MSKHKGSGRTPAESAGSDEKRPTERPALGQPTLPGVPDAAGNAYDEALMASERARLMFEDDAAHAEWLDQYFALIAEGWSWRQAVYMIWASQPKPRTPATEKALATEVLGLTSARSIRTWKAENPHMELRIRKLSLAALGHARNEVLQALIESAQTPSYRNYRDRELFLKMTGDYVPRERLDVGAVSAEQDLAALSAEELAAQAQIPVDHGRAPAENAGSAKDAD